MANSPGFAVLQLGEGLTVTLSLEQAGTSLRAPANEDQLREVQRILAAEAPDNSTRLRAMQQKLAGGELTDLAEVTRDDINDDRKRANRSGSTLPPSQRALYLKDGDCSPPRSPPPLVLGPGRVGARAFSSPAGLTGRHH